MKRSTYLILGMLVCILPASLQSQTTYTYPLIQSFNALEAGAPELIQIPNNYGYYGEFVQRMVPASTCGQTGMAPGYFFEDDAGLQFNNPPEVFINQSYSLAMNFQVDEFITPPPWVRLLSFTHTDDIGVYIKLTNPPDYGTLEFWPYGTVGTTDFFTTVDFYQLILVRNDAGLIKIYINGEVFAEYDDSQTQKFVPGPPNNYIVFFRDDPYVLEDEASPGFVSDIIITNYAWTEDQVQAVWDDFCNSLLNVPEPVNPTVKIFPNPAGDQVFIQFDREENANVMITDLTGKICLEQDLSGNLLTLDISALRNGLYFLTVRTGNRTSTIKLNKIW